MSKYRSRTHMLLLYPENDDHKKAHELITKSYDYASILHDRDVWTEEDEQKNPEHKAGTYKKPHWHIVIRFQTQKWSSAICKELGITENYIEDVKKFDNALQYLIHYNDDNKTKYDVEEVLGNLKIKLKESLNNIEKGESEKVKEMIDFINSQDVPISVTDFAIFCASNGYWSEFRRSGAIFCKILEEHNLSLR